MFNNRPSLTRYFSFLNGLLLALIFFFYTEDQYEKDIFSVLAKNVYLNSIKNGSVDTILLIEKSVLLVNTIEEDRKEIFDNFNSKSFKYFLHPVSFDLMTGNGDCGSYSMILSRLLIELGLKVRIAQMKVNGKYGGHIVCETRIKDTWVVLDPFYNIVYKRSDGSLASFLEIKSNWQYYKNQTPSNYNRSYCYEDVRYSNWNKIPFLLNGLKHLLVLFMGERNVQDLSLRILFLSKYNFLLKMTFILLIINILYISFINYLQKIK